MSGKRSETDLLKHSFASSYFVPEPSRWPLLTSLSAALLLCGVVMLIYALPGALAALLVGYVGLTYCMYGWWSDVVDESEGGRYGEWEDMSFRWGMGWFIISEVLFFAAFFGMLFYARTLVMPDLASADAKLIWPDYNAGWPSRGPLTSVDFQTIPVFGLPALNTMILLTSGATVTWAHWGLKTDRRRQLIGGLIVTVLLGMLFLVLQAGEFIHAYEDLNLKLTSGIYGSTFFMLTGFHGLHVTIGTIGLMVILLRCIKGHFSAERHFGFEAVAWYWHFVDVIWLMLWVVVYWL